jgi:phosphoribosylamine--glycine ligase
MMRLQSDLGALCLAALGGQLDTVDAQWDPRPALGVVLAAGGYPGDYEKGAAIHGLDAAAAEDVKVFHAGTRSVGDEIVTSGGRVLCVTALGSSIAEAQSRAYASVDAIEWANMVYRRDIGWRAVRR